MYVVTSTPSTSIAQVSLKARSELDPLAVSDTEETSASVVTDWFQNGAAPATCVSCALPDCPV